MTPEKAHGLVRRYSVLTKEIRDCGRRVPAGNCMSAVTNLHGAWKMTDEELTEIYNRANDITVKNPPITTERIFRAMREAMVVERAACLQAVKDAKSLSLVWYPPGYSIDPNKVGTIYEHQLSKCVKAIEQRSEP